MGCDIHLYVEKRVRRRWIPVNPPKDSSYGEFVDVEPTGMELLMTGLDEEVSPATISDWWVGRSYEAFGKLAGVRGGPELWPVSGIPEDASPRVRAMFDSWGVDAHTPSSVLLSDLTAPKVVPGLIANLRAYLSKWAVENGLTTEDVRIVFWFDN